MYPKYILVALLGGALLGCEAGGPAHPSDGLASASIPAGFDFSTTRAVEVAADVVADSRRIEVRLPDGATVYRGAMPQSGLRLAVPTKDRTLEVWATQSGGATAHTVLAIHDGVAERSDP